MCFSGRKTREERKLCLKIQLSGDCCDGVCDNGHLQGGSILNSDWSIWIWARAPAAGEIWAPAQILNRPIRVEDRTTLHVFWAWGACGFIQIIGTVVPQFNKPPFNEVLDVTNNILYASQSYSKMYGIEPRYSKFFDTTNIIQKHKHKIYFDIMNYNVNMQQKINAAQINRQQIFLSWW